MQPSTRTFSLGRTDIHPLSSPLQTSSSAVPSLLSYCTSAIESLPRNSEEEAITSFAPISPSPFCSEEAVKGVSVLLESGQESVGTNLALIQSQQQEHTDSSVLNGTLTDQGLLSSTFSTAIKNAGSFPFCHVRNKSGGPPHGVKAICGKRSKMEDSYQVQTNFFTLPLLKPSDMVAQDKLPARIADQMDQFVCSTIEGLPDCMLSASPTAPGKINLASSSGLPQPGSEATLHFFGVYDGHGGFEASQHCANRLHHHLSEALSRISHPSLAAHSAHQPGDESNFTVECDRIGGSEIDGENVVGIASGAEDGNAFEGALPQEVCFEEKPCCDNREVQDTIEGPLDPQASPPSAPIFRLTEGQISATPTPIGFLSTPATLTEPVEFTASPPLFPDLESSDAVTSEAPLSVSELLQEALRQAFRRTDAEFGADDTASVVGSTAVVALLGKRSIWVANCGDSRAVLCRSGRAVQLTDDHKPERQDEAERVEKAGGHVLFWNGHRVMGVLAMSRAIGDHGLRPYIIPEPEISVVARSQDDEFLLLASDGLWDVLSNQEAVDLTRRCLSRAVEKGASRKAAVRIAASVLTKAATDQGSRDNITVVVIDLKSMPPAKQEVGSSIPAASSEHGNHPGAPQKTSELNQEAAAGP